MKTNHIIAVLISVIGLTSIATSSAIHGSYQYEAEAEAASLVAQGRMVVIEELRASRDSLINISALAVVAYEDSLVSWSRERSRLRIAAAEDEKIHASLADSVRARVDSTTSVMVTRMEDALVSISAQRDSIESSKDAQIAALFRTSSFKDQIISNQEDALSNWEKRDSARDAVEDAMRGEIASRKRERNLGYGVAAIATLVAVIL